jgi:glycosyltransferase involved in cell wall biosynthesis
MQPSSVCETQCKQCSGKTAKLAKNRSASGLKLISQPSSKTNPYQKLLIEQLEMLGVQREELKSLTSLLKNRQATYVLHLHWLHQYFALPSAVDALIRTVKFIGGLVIKRFMGVKIVWTVHNLKDHENRNPFLDRICSTLVAKLAHAIITHCELAKFQVAENFNLWNHNKIFVVPHGNYIDYYENRIDQSEARKGLGISDSNLSLLFLGKIRPYKGVIELIEVFKQLHPDEVQLVIAGKVSNPQEAEPLNRKISSCDNIKFVPDFVPDDQIQVYMKACDVVVFPYRDVLTSGAVLLAMSFGRACIAPRHGCIGEILDDSGAILYNPHDEAGLAQAINCAIQKKHELPDMGNHNRRLAEQWPWTRIAEMTLNVYQQCLRS